MAGIDYAGAEGDAYHKERHSEFFESRELVEAWAAYAHIRYFPNLLPTERVLEIGAGLGVNLLSIQKVAEVHAVEPSAAAREHCATLGVRAVASMDALPAEMLFDHILLRHVLEHVSDPREMLDSIRPRLKSGGRFIVAVPCESPFLAPDPNDIDHHVYSWNPRTLSNLLEDAGFKVLSARLNWRNGRRLFLPLFRWFGARTYTRALTALGWLRRYCEIVVEATAART